MPLFGAHLSIAGGYHKALLEAQRFGCETVQLFTKSSNQWAAKEITDDEAAKFRGLVAELSLKHPTAHDSYLINLASPDDALYRRSIDAFVIELQRAEKLGLSYLVTHPGAHMAGTEEEGLKRVAKGLDEAHGRCPGFRVQVLLETTAGQGTSLGHRFEHLAYILELVKDPDRVGVCLDTCHVFAAGYSLATPTEYKATMKEFDKTVGIERLRLFHINDSLKKFGSRVDRHAHLGRGEVGLEPFRFLVNDARFQSHPMILETPKEDGEIKDMDTVNLAALRGLVK